VPVNSIITLTMNPAIDLSTSVARVVPTHKLRCASAGRDPGGGGINVARVVSRLGGNATAIYPTGGVSGQLLKHLVEREGVTSSTFTVAEETRLNITILEDQSGDEYRFVLPGPALEPAEWQQALDMLESLPPKPCMLVMSGSLPPGAPEDFYARAARLARRPGGTAVLDTSGPALAAALKEGVFLIKPNLRELRELTGQELEGETSWHAACSGLVASGQTEVVALTLGDKGALLVSRDGALRAPALPIDAASAVGAGDSFLGGMVWALASGNDLEEAFRYGVAAGSAALLTPGTQLCRREDVMRLYGQVVLHPL
jgi:6-phosphofructokinase 2